MAEKDGERIYIQVAYMLMDQSTINREFGNLLSIDDPYPKYVITMDVIYRQTEANDNEVLSRLIKKVFEDFGIDIPGTVYTDPTTDALYELFQTPGSVYWIAEENHQILGGCG